MLHTVRLIPRNYVPDDIEIGMLFFTDRIIQIEKVPPSREAFLEEYGYPVEFYLVDQDPNLRWSNILATPQQIGWFDFDPEGEDFVEINVEHLNLIALEYEGWCQIDVWYNNLDDDEAHDEYIKVMPDLLDGKVVIHTMDFEEEEEEEDDDDSDEYEYDDTDLDDDTWQEE
jgi:hypothetical protein